MGIGDKVKNLLHPHHKDASATASPASGTPNAMTPGAATPQSGMASPYGSGSNINPKDMHHGGEISPGGATPGPVADGPGTNTTLEKVVEVLDKRGEPIQSAIPFQGTGFNSRLL